MDGYRLSHGDNVWSALEHVWFLGLMQICIYFKVKFVFKDIYQHIGQVVTY